MTNSEILKNIWDALDIKKIDDDINEGISKAQIGNAIEINKFISKIQKDYELYINLYNSVQNLKRNIAGVNQNQPAPVDDSINHYIKFLQQLRLAKSLGKEFNEIFN